MELGLAAAGALATVAAAVTHRASIRRRTIHSPAYVSGRAAVSMHPYIRPPVLQGQLKARSVFIDDWRGRKS